ncbi:MAG: SDR family oxidoreductase [Kordiimonadaceae bacterium]|nr:SDR family oxidoreductase [Kordiimonadaceae bacterium]
MSKIILITGSSTGFGRQTAEILVKEGNTVYASMRDPAGRNRENADALRALGAKVVELDVTDNASTDGAVAAIIEAEGRLDVLVNNAGSASVGVSEAFTPEQASALFDVNVFGLQRVTRAVLPTFRAQNDGLIINIGSILGRVTFPFFGLYGASKFAVEALTDSYRLELSQLGVDVALIQPSAYPTDMYANVTQPEDTARSDAYGETGKIPEAMFGSFMEMFAADDAPKPFDVAVAIAKLVNTAKGQRAARTVVGNSFGADTLNDAAAPVQAGVVEALGLGHLATLKAA